MRGRQRRGHLAEMVAGTVGDALMGQDRPGDLLGGLLQLIGRLAGEAIDQGRRCAEFLARQAEKGGSALAHGSRR